MLRVDEELWGKIYVQNELHKHDPSQQNDIIRDLDREIFGDD